MGVHDANYSKIKKELGVPEEEPIFVLRAQDSLSIGTLQRYINFARGVSGDDQDVPPPSPEWFEQMEGVVRVFGEFQHAHPAKVKLPD